MHKTRRYVVNYNILDNELNVPAEQKLFVLIKNIVTEYKSHCNAKYFAHKFANNTMRIFILQQKCRESVLALK